MHSGYDIEQTEVDRAIDEYACTNIEYDETLDNWKEQTFNDEYCAKLLMFGLCNYEGIYIINNLGFEIKNSDKDCLIGENKTINYMRLDKILLAESGLNVSLISLLESKINFVNGIYNYMQYLEISALEAYKVWYNTLKSRFRTIGVC